MDNELEKLHAIGKITEKIYRTYNKLYELEINGKKDGEEYNKTLSSLILLSKKEEKIYKKADFTYLEFMALAQNLKREKIKLFGFDINDILLEKYRNRILKIISDSFKNNDLNNMFLIDVKKILNSIQNDVEIYRSFDRDKVNILLLFIEEYITDDNYKEYKNELIKFKYILSFDDKETEADMIMNSFDVKNSFYMSSEMISDFLEVNKNYYSIIKTLYGNELFYDSINSLLKTEDVYTDEAEIIFNQCMIRTSLMFLKEDAYLKVKEQFYKEISKLLDEEYSFDNVNLIIKLLKEEYEFVNESLIIGCLEKYYEDLSKFNKVSLEVSPEGFEVIKKYMKK